MGEAAIVAAMSTAVSTIQSQAAARAQQREQQAAANRQIQAQRMQQERREKDMRENAKREQATARASFGARGVSSTAGSSNALLQGISAQTEQSIADDRKLLDFSIENLRENQRAQQRRNQCNAPEQAALGIPTQADTADQQEHTACKGQLGDPLGSIKRCWPLRKIKRQTELLDNNQCIGGPQRRD